MALTISRVLALPETLAPETMYLVKSGAQLTVTVTGTTGAVVASTVTMGDVNAAISSAIGSLDMSNSVEFAADIAARDAMTLTKSAFVYVQDATGDATVTAGAAMYLYNLTAETWTKVTEYESMDLVLSWANLQDKPTSTVAAIDDAVANAHIHENKAALDLIGVDENGQLTYNGEVVGGVVTNGNEW